MFNGNISMKFYDMSQFARSKGKKTVQRAHCALESIFLHNPDTCLNIYMKEDMEDAVEVLFHVKRLQNDGFLIFVLQYNFRALLTRTLSQIKAIRSHIVDQFFQQLPSHEKGE